MLGSCNAASDAKTASSQISTAVDRSREFSATLSRNVKIAPQLLITISKCEAYAALAAPQTVAAVFSAYCTPRLDTNVLPSMIDEPTTFTVISRDEAVAVA